jgi:hypothetical protein
MNIYRSSSHPTLEVSTFKLIYDILLLIGGLDICAHDHSITEFMPTSLKQENMASSLVVLRHPHFLN